MAHIYDMIIIGGGPAGYTAALYASRAGLDTLLVERMSAGGQMAITDVIDNYPGFEEGIDGFTLGMKMQASAERFGAKTEYAEVTDVQLDADIKKVTTTSGEFLSRTVVVATGANPRALGIEGEDALIGRGLHYCAHCDGRFYKDKVVMVVGGGNSAAADALYLSRLAKKVYLVHRRDTLRATKIYHAPLMQAENIEFVWDSALTDYIVEQRVAGAKVKNLKSGEESEILVDCTLEERGIEQFRSYENYADRVIRFERNLDKSLSNLRLFGIPAKAFFEKREEKLLIKIEVG